MRPQPTLSDLIARRYFPLDEWSLRDFVRSLPMRCTNSATANLLAHAFRYNFINRIFFAVPR
jgi:hypothetical protein